MRNKDVGQRALLGMQGDSSQVTSLTLKGKRELERWDSCSAAKLAASVTSESEVDTSLYPPSRPPLVRSECCSADCIACRTQAARDPAMQRLVMTVACVQPQGGPARVLRMLLRGLHHLQEPVLL